LDPASSVQRQVMLIKVRADQSVRPHIIQTVELFRAAVIDVGTETLTIQATGNADKLRALLEVLEPFGIKELVQSGHIGIGRGSRSMTDRALRSA
ncbi:MAG: acetolactate synthase small subunit, partial [Dermatophilaceae bacterium]